MFTDQGIPPTPFDSFKMHASDRMHETDIVVGKRTITTLGGLSDTQSLQPYFVVSIQQNESFFGDQLGDFKVILMQTVDDWNFFFGKGRFRKTAGDRLAGAIVGGDTIICYPPKQLQDLTSLVANPDESVQERFENLLTHELAHIQTLNLIGGQQLPRWMWEGIAMTVAKKNLLKLLQKELKKC